MESSTKGTYSNAWDNACDKFSLSVQAVFIWVRSICFLCWPVLFLFLISPRRSYEAEDATKASPSELSLGDMRRTYIGDTKDFCVAQKRSEGWDSCLAGRVVVVKSSQTAAAVTLWQSLSLQELLCALAWPAPLPTPTPRSENRLLWRWVQHFTFLCSQETFSMHKISSVSNL